MSRSMPMDVMLSTEGDACLNSAMVDFSSAIRSPRGVTARAAVLGLLSVALPNQDCCASRMTTDDNATTGQRYFLQREIDTPETGLLI